LNRTVGGVRKTREEITRMMNEEVETPAYGSKSYWDARYTDEKSSLPRKRQKCDDENCCDTKKEDGEQMHAWYYTYEELEPLISSTLEEIYEYNGKQSTRICEIGCGDVPLGESIFSNLNKMHATNSSEDDPPLINRMVCSDYSSVVIAKLQEKSKKQAKERPQPEYIEADARKLSKYFINNADKLSSSQSSEHDSQSCMFEMVIDKGTLDTMLSDPKEGKSNCKQITSEATSLLSIGGCFIIVSHLNANDSSGLGWLQEVVIGSLDMQYRWDINVHSGPGNESDDKDENEEEEVNMWGPAVYIISKRHASEKNNYENGEIEEIYEETEEFSLSDSNSNNEEKSVESSGGKMNDFEETIDENSEDEDGDEEYAEDSFVSINFHYY